MNIYKGLGYELEEEFICTLGEWFRNNGEPEALQVKSGSREDLLQGTDLRIYGVPCDITCNISGKDHTDRLSESVPLFRGTFVSFGVRTGNSHKGYTPFPEPVLVIGIEGATENFLGTWMPRIMSAVKRLAQEIIEVGQSQYWDWIDEKGGAI